MKLVTNWRAVLRHAWSVRLLLLAAVLSGLEATLPLLAPYLPIPDRLFAALTGLTVGAALFARFLAQKGVSDAGPKDQAD
ncbi:hypothetical protein AB4037_29320 [Labrys sp. KB_33_2]|uniref:DUF7940 domain-containing protein n=1 Tax=Labrys sp. KB_33_2 TaxID=3237479 RepID=UPI003F902243